MRDWLLMFRPETFAIVCERGIIGVRAEHRRRFAEIAEGDRFIAFISKRGVLDGYGRFVGEAFVDDSPVFGPGNAYTHRFAVKLDKTGAAAPVGHALWALDVWKSQGRTLSTTPSNLLFCYGGFMEIPPSDFERLAALVDE